MRALDTPSLLEAAQKGDNDACERLILDNSGLIWSVARRYYGRGVDPEDLYILSETRLSDIVAAAEEITAIIESVPASIESVATVV